MFIRGIEALASVAQRWNRPVAVALLCFGGATLLLSAFAPSSSLVISPAEIRQEEGEAFVAPIVVSSSHFYKLISDDVSSARGSTLALFEDDRPLGQAHAPHAAVRESGRGRYSHWGDNLWFSTSDGSDPRANGRVYRAEYRLTTRPAWRFSGLVALVFGLALLGFGARGSSGGVAGTGGVVARLLEAAALPRRLRRSLIFQMAVLGALAGAAAVVGGWHWGDTPLSGLAIARYLPVSDAFGYHSCATAISLTGSFDQPFGGGWCSRRALYPAMLASVLALSGWSSQMALIVQGMMVGVAFAAFVIQLRERFGLLAAAVSATLLAFYAWQFVLGLFMTEVTGFLLGMAGLAVLIRHADTGRRWGIAAGSAVFSIALTARAGALFALPALVVWAVFAFGAGGIKGRMKMAAACTAGLLVGPAMQVVLVWLLGADPLHSGGNFAASLYGLTTGSRDWTEAYRAFDHLFQINEAEAFREAYRQAFANIVARPDVFFGSLSQAAHAYFEALFLFDEIYMQEVTVLFVLAGVGLASCIANIRRPPASLLLALALAEFLSAPLIFDSGGNRVFAATLAVRVTLVAVGIHCLLGGLAAWAGRSVPIDVSGERELFDANIGIAGLVILLMLLAVSPIPGLLRPVATEAKVCDEPLNSIVSHIGREAQTMRIVVSERPAVSIWPFRITANRLRDDQRMDQTWFGQDFLALAPPTTVTRAVDLQGNSYGSIRPVIIQGDPVGDSRDLVLLCVDLTESVELAGVRHYVVRQRRSLASTD